MPRLRPPRLTVRFSDEELARVRGHARRRGLAPSSYLRFLARVAGCFSRQIARPSP